MRVLVLGGRGNFGARIVRALAGETDVRWAGRREGVDIASPALPAMLAKLKPGIVVHCAGPFQGQDYRVAAAALAAGAHYIDLADGRGFVAGFADALDEAARRAGRVAISGASTLPALSSAVVDALRPRFARLTAIDTVIAPGQHAPRGRATLAGVLSYAGKPFDAWEAGEWRRRFGWMHVARVDCDPLPPRLSAVCDVPDLALFPSRYAGVQSVRFRAALEVGAQHRAIACLAGLRRLGLPVPVEKLAGAMEGVARWMDRFGSGNGMMAVRLEGVDTAGQAMALRWHVLAPANHGPEIPCMAAIVLVRRLIRKEVTTWGAGPCMGWVALADFEREFAKWGMTSEVITVAPAEAGA